MKPVYFRLALAVLLLSALAACSHSNSGDPTETPVGTTDTNRFWIFPNPVEDPATGVYTTNDVSYGQAYYTTMDPANRRDTLAKFQTMHGFGGGGGTEVSVVFRDTHDLGYGRRLTVRRYQNSVSPTNGLDANSWVVAAYVENYQVVPFAGDDYTSLNLEAAIKVDRNWHVGTNAIEYSTVGGKTFTKFFTYSPSGTRLNTVNLDGRGQKAMPSVCINCHGGRADPLTATGAFPRGGDTWGRMQPLNVGSFEFWGSSPYQRVDQEASLKLINQMVLCTYPLGAASADAEDACRPIVAADVWQNEWQSAAAEMVKAWYGGSGMPNGSFADNYWPAGWNQALSPPTVSLAPAEQKSLYDNVVAPYCRTCHIVRGTGNNSTIDFTNYYQFASFSDRIKVHVFDRGNMPLGLVVYDRFWKSTAPSLLATWLDNLPIADSTAPSMSPNPQHPTRDANGNVVQPHGELADQVLLPASGTAIRFANIKAILQDSTTSCVDCHNHAVIGSSFLPPIFYGDVTYPGGVRTVADFDRDGDGFVTPADDYEFYLEIRGRINFTDFLASPLLRRPSWAGKQHYGGNPSGFDIYFGLGTRTNYDTFLEWIQHGAPYN